MTGKRTPEKGPEESGPDAETAPAFKLPSWTSTAYYWFNDCDDPSQVAFDRWLMAEFPGFNLAEFDTWLAGLYECGARGELLRDRAIAFNAYIAGNRDMVHMTLKSLSRAREMIIGKPLALHAQNLRKTQGLPRGSQKPKTDEWITGELVKDPTVSDKALWRRLPSEASGADVYSDGVQAFELGGDGRPKGRPMKVAGFNSRVSDAREKLKNDVSK